MRIEVVAAAILVIAHVQWVLSAVRAFAHGPVLGRQTLIAQRQTAASTVGRTASSSQPEKAAAVTHGTGASTTARADVRSSGTATGRRRVAATALTVMRPGGYVLVDGYAVFGVADHDLVPGDRAHIEIDR
ncbi:hypothetical protein GCM10028772_08770 [Nocardioides ultimimeridianus]